MPKRILNAHTMVGAGLGGATGLAINRLALGNKSLLSNLVATGLGGALGGTAGYLLKKYTDTPESPSTKALRQGKTEDDAVLKRVSESLGNPEKEREVREELRNAGVSDARINQMFNSAEHSKEGFTVRPVSRSIAAGIGGVLGETAYRVARNKTVGKPAELEAETRTLLRTKAGPTEVKIDPNSGLATVTGYVRKPKSAKSGKNKTKIKFEDVKIDIDPNTITDPKLRQRLADELIGDRRVKQGWWVRRTGKPSEKAQAKFIADNATQHRLTNAPVIRWLASKIKNQKIRNGLKKFTDNVKVNRGTAVASLRAARPALWLAGITGGLIGESATQDYDPKLVNRFDRLR